MYVGMSVIIPLWHLEKKHAVSAVMKYIRFQLTMRRMNRACNSGL